MKRVFITGASSGIGEALALAYAKKKYTVGLTARRLKLLENISLRCTNLGAKTFIYKLDVNNQRDCEVIAQKFQKEANGIDIVIANAGIGGDDGLSLIHI